MSLVMISIFSNYPMSTFTKLSITSLRFLRVLSRFHTSNIIHIDPYTIIPTRLQQTLNGSHLKAS